MEATFWGAGAMGAEETCGEVVGWGWPSEEGEKGEGVWGT